MKKVYSIDVCNTILTQKLHKTNTNYHNSNTKPFNRHKIHKNSIEEYLHKSNTNTNTNLDCVTHTKKNSYPLPSK